MQKCVVDRFSPLLLVMALSACATAKAPGPIADYCTAVVGEVRACGESFEKGSPTSAAIDACGDLSAISEAKMRTALALIPKDSPLRLKTSLTSAYAHLYVAALHIGAATKASLTDPNLRAIRDAVIRDCAEITSSTP